MPIGVRKGGSLCRLGHRLGIIIAFAGDCIDSRGSCIWRMLRLAKEGMWRISAHVDLS